MNQLEKEKAERAHIEEQRLQYEVMMLELYVREKEARQQEKNTK